MMALGMGNNNTEDTLQEKSGIDCLPNFCMLCSIYSELCPRVIFSLSGSLVSFEMVCYEGGILVCPLNNLG